MPKKHEQDYSQLSAIELDDIMQFNISNMESSVLSPLGELLGAIGKGTLKMAATKFEIQDNIIRISQLGLYIRDTFDFKDDWHPEVLGFWSNDGPTKFSFQKTFGVNVIRGRKEILVFNSDFNEYRKKCSEKGEVVG